QPPPPPFPPLKLLLPSFCFPLLLHETVRLQHRCYLCNGETPTIKCALLTILPSVVLLLLRQRKARVGCMSILMVNPGRDDRCGAASPRPLGNHHPKYLRVEIPLCVLEDIPNTCDAEARTLNTSLMPPGKCNTIRSPLKDLTNISNDDGAVLCNLQPPVEDPKERRRQRDREQYARMDPNKKAEILKNKRDSRHKKKTSLVTQEKHVEASLQDAANISKDERVVLCNLQPPIEDPKERRRQRDREQYARMDPNSKAEMLKNKRDA
ncbi:hypothetical protein U9M48_008842, partial [Paspalum notatum var. saurae]